MSNIILNTQVADAITATVEALRSADRKMTSAVDIFVANKMRSTDFISPKSNDSTASPEMFEQINAAIVAGFTATARKLLEAPTKGLEDAEKAEKRYLQQQIGARRNDFKRALEKRENVGADGTPNRTRTIDEWFRDMANDGIKKLRNAEEAPFQIDDMMAAMNKVLDLAKR